MGSICAVKKNGAVYIAGNEISEVSNANFDGDNLSSIKIHKMSSGVVVAAVGPTAVTQHLWLHDEWFVPNEGETFDKRFIVTKIIPRFYDEIKEMDVWSDSTKKRCRMMESPANFIIAKGEDLYFVDDKLDVIKCDEAAAIGDAFSILLMHVTVSTESDPEVTLKRAYEFASKRNAKVSTHGYIINTNDLTFKKMEDVR